MYAALNGHIQTVSLLLRNGADINQVNSCGNNALMAASNTFKMDVAELLIRNGAHPDHQNMVSALSISSRDGVKRLILTIVWRYCPSDCSRTWARSANTAAT